MSNKRIKLSVIYTCLCVTILVITGIISDISAFTLFVRSCVFGIISFLLIFFVQRFLKNSIIKDNVFDNDKQKSDAKGNAINVVVDDAYDSNRENSFDSTDDIEKVEYNISRRINSALFDKTMDRNDSRKVADTFVDLTHEIKRSQKKAGGNPEESSNALRKWIHDAQSKNM